MSDAQDTKAIARTAPSMRGFGLFVVLAIGLFGLIRSDLIVDVEYRTARVVAVQQVPGRDLVDRLVIVDLGDYQRALRTSDWMLRTDPGRPVCVRRARFLLRAWVRHSLALPGYCRMLRVPVGEQPLSAGPLPE